MRTSVFVAAALLLVAGCRRDEAPAAQPATSAAPAKVAPAAEGAAPAVKPEPAAKTALPVAHDPEHPPIDCPLRAQGVDPHQLQPFEKVAEYIAFLERPDRAAWQKPDAVVAALGLRGDEVVADVGAGSGYFAFRLAAALPRGRVVAADIEPAMVRHMHHRSMTQQVDNLEARLVDAGDPKVPSGVDLVFICDVLHHVTGRAAWLGKVAAALKPGARLALIEFREGKLPAGPPEAVKIPRRAMVELLKGAGFRLVEDRSELLPYQYFLVFERT